MQGNTAEKLYDEGMLLYQNSLDVPRSELCFRQAAELGHSGAQYNLGLIYLNGDIKHKDYDEAVKWFSMAAAQGHLDAQNELGRFYLHGWSLVQNYKKAEELFLLAAKQGHLEAQFNMGYFHWPIINLGWLEFPNDWLKKADPCKYDYYYPHEKIKKSKEWYQKAARRGHMGAQLRMGYYYMTRGDWSDFDQAVQWYHKAAEQNCADAQFELARHYYYGCGVVTNYSLSKSLLMKSAQHGNLNAQKILNERSLRDRISGKIPMPDYYKCNFVVPKCRILPGKNNKLYLASVI